MRKQTNNPMDGKFSPGKMEFEIIIIILLCPSPPRA
jgi:hypothetical protein